MNNIKPWIESLRLKATIPTFFLTHIGFVFANQKTNYLLAFIIFLIACNIMLTNDYKDRGHDLLKGKNFAYRNASKLYWVYFISWVIIGFLSYLMQTPYERWLLFLAITIGISYSYSRKILLLPTILVALTSTIPGLLALQKSDNSWPFIFLSITVFCVIFARETIKDIEDKIVDIGYKKTLLSQNIITTQGSTHLSAFFIGIGLLASLGLYSFLGTFTICIYWLGFAFSTTSIIILWKLKIPTKLSKNLLDIGMGIIIASFSLIPLEH